MRYLTNARITPASITGEEIPIPESYPFAARLNEVPDREHDVAVTRIGPAETVYSQGDGSCRSSGTYTGDVNRDMVVEVDSAGPVGTATFRWSSTGGATWDMSGVNTSTEPVELADGISVSFNGQNLLVGDRWRFTAERFARAPGSPTGPGTFYVDFSRGYLEFHSADAGKTVKASYTGTGSLVDAADINEIAARLSRAGGFVMSAGSGETFVTDATVGGGSRIFLSPRNQAAASLDVYVSAVLEGSGFRVKPGGSAAGTEQFDYMIFG